MAIVEVQSATFETEVLKSTNPLERLNEELRRREKSIRIFPDEKSCMRLLGAILQGYSEDWTSGRIYLSEPLEKIREIQKRPGSVESQQGRLFMKKNLTWIYKMKTMQLVAWPYIDCE